MKTNNAAGRATMRAAAVLVTLGLLGCDSSTDPVAAADTDEEQRRRVTPSFASIFEGVYHSGALITCNANMVKQKIICTSPQDPSKQAVPVAGGRGMKARLEPGGVTYVADSSYLRTSVRVRNLLYHSIGTRDGPALNFKVFFQELPVTTGGTGTVTLANPTGTAEFTAVNQPYFRYNERLNSLERSGAKQWRFNVPATVSRFRFKVYVSAPILPMVAFDMDVGGNRDIYRVNIDGTNLTRLTTHAGVDMSPTIANDSIVFVSYRDGNAELYMVPLGGGAPTRLTNTLANETQPALSPNNRFLAYVSDVTGMPRVWWGPADLSTAQQAPPKGHGAVIEGGPAWMTNGGRIVYVSTQEGKANIFRYNISSGGVQKLITAGPDVPRFEPKFDKAMTTMVHTAPLAGNPDNTEVYIYDVATTDVTRITTRGPADSRPTFLHDGRIAWLAFTNPTIWALRWTTLDESSAANIPLPAAPYNPAGVPLR